MMNNLCTISMTDDDKYVIEVREEKKGKKGKDNGMVMMDEWKQYVAVDKEELHELIDKYIPNIKTKKEKDDEEYNKGWDKAKEKDEDKGEE